MSIATTERLTSLRRPARPAREHLRAVPAEELRGLAIPRTVADNLGVPTVHRTVVDYANFDHAASTPALESVKRAVDAALRTYASVHRGNGYASRVTTRWYEQARAEVARFVGARADDLVVFTRGTTDSLNLLARALPSGTRVFVFESEHHAALLPWQARHTVRLPVPGSQADALELLEDALASAPEGPKLVVVTGASNVTGELWPVADIVGVARRYAARVALDAAQLAPHRPVDIAKLGVDYVVLSGHKLYAPFGTGVLAGRADWLEAAQPYLRGGGATARVTETEVVWSAGASRHEAGSPNVIGAVALAAACATFQAHRDAIELHEETLAARLRHGLAGIEGVTTYSMFGPASERVGVVAFTVPGVPSALVSAALSAEHGIGVRDGKFCAHLLVDALLEDRHSPSAPTTAVRASVGLANTVEQVDRLVEAVRTLATTGPNFDYELTDCGWEPVDDPRDLSLPRPW
ncbi:MAG TPA: aminotransferase class V-fold PLP-dependent enzyme [Dermatophilaceae bacterium]|nr:aminotransferase class V-fold PLP-dependent enzyme [Dermatophilaceae bacterium]